MNPMASTNSTIHQIRYNTPLQTTPLYIGGVVVCSSTAKCKLELIVVLCS